MSFLAKRKEIIKTAIIFGKVEEYVTVSFGGVGYPDVSPKITIPIAIKIIPLIISAMI